MAAPIPPPPPVTTTTALADRGAAATVTAPIEPHVELQALAVALLEPLLQQLAVAEVVAQPAAEVAVARVHRLRGCPPC